MDGFWETQEELESEMGWNTEENIRQADNTEEARLEELNFSLYRAFAESAEMYHEATGISLDKSRGQEISDEQYDNLSYEAVDILLFLKKAGDTLNESTESYLTDERKERYEESGDGLDELLEPGLEPEIQSEEHRVSEIKSYAEDIVEEIGPNPFDGIYREASTIDDSNDYSEDKALGEKLASTMLDMVEMVEYICIGRNKEVNELLKEKQEKNIERQHSGEDFGEGNGDYLETPNKWLTKPEDEETEPAYINMIS